MPKKLKRKTLKNKLKKLWKTIEKEKANCEVCQSLPVHERIDYTQLHPHHIVGEKFERLRYNLRNRVWVCSHHHKFGKKSAHNSAIWFSEWMKKNRYADWNFLRKELEKEDIKYTIEDLQEMLDHFLDD